MAFFVKNIVGEMLILKGTPKSSFRSSDWSGCLRTRLLRHRQGATDVPEAGTVISGMRKSSDVMVFVDVARAMAAGVVFYRSANGVILTAGAGPYGVVAPCTALAAVTIAAHATSAMSSATGRRMATSCLVL